jgi:enediyne biosynthesis protein E4
LDLFVTSFGGNTLYRNRGDGSFQDVTAQAGLAAAGVRWGSGCTFVDYDRDGRLDLFIANYLTFDLASAPEPGRGANCVWKGIPVNCGPKGLPTDTNLLFHNEGGGVFRDVSAPSGVARVTGRYSMTAAGADFDGDAWPDIYVACDSTASILYRNNRDGTFTDTAVEAGVAYGEYGAAQAGMGLAAGDYDRDGRIDLLKTHFADDVPALYRNLGRGQFEEASVAAGLGAQNRYVEWGAGMPDLDNDGWPEVVYVTGNVYPEIERHLPQYPHRGPRVVFRNLGGGRFEDVSARSGPGATAAHSSRGAAFGDVDNDGDVDVLVTVNGGRPRLLLNEASDGNWLLARLEGRADNRQGLGARVGLTTDDGVTLWRQAHTDGSYLSASDPRVHFGLGAKAGAVKVVVEWPRGAREEWRSVRANQILTLQQGSGRH